MDENSCLFDDATAQIQKDFNVAFGRFQNMTVLCPFHEDTVGSCSVGSNGLFNCHACGASGTSEKFATVNQVRLRQETYKTLRPLRSHSARSIETGLTTETTAPIRQTLGEECHERLMTDSDSAHHLRYLLDERKLSEFTLARYHIGCDEHRITIPIYEGGRLVNIRRYLPYAERAPKIVSHTKGDGTPRLWPDWVTSYTWTIDRVVVIAEGEWDCLLLLQNGYLAVTSTGGARAWKDEWYNRIKRCGMRIIIAYDNDPVGRQAATERVEGFGNEALSINLRPHKDITDVFRDALNPKEFIHEAYYDALESRSWQDLWTNNLV